MPIEEQQPELVQLESNSKVSSIDARKNFVGNILSNVIFFVFNITTSFFMTPYQLRHLGDANYGVVFLANQFVSYTNIIAAVMVTTLFRFVTIHLARNEESEARKYFNTQYVVTLVFCALFLPVASVISYYTPLFINIPPGQENNTRWLFMAMYMSFLITMVCNPFQIALFAKQRFDIRNWIMIINQVFRYGTWIAMFALFAPAIWHIGLGFFIAAMSSFVLGISFFYKFTPNLRPNLREFDKTKFIEMIKMGGWMAVSQVGVVLYIAIDPLILNRYIPLEMVGKYVAILGIAVMLRGLSSTMSGMLTPLAIASYAEKDPQMLISRVARASKFVSLGLAVPLGVICGVAVPFLTLWLGPQYAFLYPLVWWLLGHQVLTCGVEPMYSINMAANKMAIPGIVTVFGGILKVVMSIMLIKYTNLGFYGLAISGFACFVLKNVLFTPWYAGRTLSVSSWPLYKSLIPAIIAYTIVSFASLLTTRLISINRFVELAAVIFALFVISGAAIYYMAINSEDRAFLKSTISRKKKLSS